MKDSKLLSLGLFKSGLRRFWPLWLAYFIALILTFDAPMYSAAIQIAGNGESLAVRTEAMQNLWYSARIGSLAFACVAAIVVAVALDEHLFEGRAATFVGSLPMRRQSVFATEFAVGYVALLGVVGLAVVALLPLRVVVGPIFSLKDMCVWYVIYAAVAFVLYAFAQLSCHLAGSRAIAVLLYGVINFLAVCLEAAVNLVVSSLQFGMSNLDYVSYKFSPVIGLSEAILRGMGRGAAPDWLELALYVLVALLVAVGTGMLFARRNLESAGESIAIPVLRPVLKYLGGISMGLLFSSVLCLLRLSDMADGVPVGKTGAAAIACVLAVGSMLGVLFSEMIMSRSARVLGRCWRDGLVVACVAVAFVAGCWFDVLGIAHHVPQPQEVKKVTVSWDYNGDATLTSPERIAEVCQLHQDLLGYDAWGESDGGTVALTLAYQLKNGRHLVRRYPVTANYGAYVFGEEEADTGAKLVEQFARIANTEEGRESRYEEVLDPSAKHFIQIEYYVDSDMGEYRTIEIAEEDRADFIEHALRPDLLKEPLGAVEKAFGSIGDDMLDATLTISDEPQQYDPFADVYILSEILGKDTSPNIVSWLKEHYPNIELMTNSGEYI